MTSPGTIEGSNIDCDIYTGEGSTVDTSSKMNKNLTGYIETISSGGNGETFTLIVYGNYDAWEGWQYRR